ncbi:MAG: ATP synthase F1 subunit delta [Bdellovibrionaceae bacterium]|nr:ATP synthase F1 subunit delta [Pseudobdellovibrionaceae bacterium]|tara:strand:+ start:3356 stop:3916 length:561 start_codon:yes stop_codon:yes gene_type:complete
MSLSRTYAKVLFLTTVEKEGNSNSISTYLDHLKEFSGWISENKALKIGLLGPTGSSLEKMKVVEHIGAKANFPQLLTQFLMLLAKKGRLALTKDICVALKEVQLEHEGGVWGQLESADPLSVGEISELRESFGKQIGKKIEFDVTTNPSLLAGLKVTLAGVTYDGSLRAQLERLEKSFLENTTESY